MTDPKIARCYHDPDWKYVPRDLTNIRATFERVRASMEGKATQPANVKPLKGARNAR